MAKASETKFVYLKSSSVLGVWIWRPREYTACDVEGAQLSFARAAPKVAHRRVEVVPERVHKEVAPRPSNAPIDPYLKFAKNLVKAGEAVEAWLNKPPPIQWRPFAAAPPAPPKAPPPPPPPPPPLVPLFDLQKIPDAMRKVGMPVAAKLQERWFAGQENYSRSAQDLSNEIDQNGARYAPAFADSTTVDMKWVLSFVRAKKALDELVQKQLQTPNALRNLKVSLTPHQDSKDIVAWNAAGSDFLQYHKKFQFQFQPVNSSIGQKFSEFMRQEATGLGIPDDLTGALGAFNFYAAVRCAWFDRSARGSVVAVVTHISVYVRDAYEFSGDQYLGHWNARHIAIVPAHQAVGGGGHSEWLRQPIKDGKEGDFFYPVTNADYRDWRQSHRQGGDFIIYTDRLSIRLDPPIRVML
ncbi:MAG: DUF6402 family protein [Pseudomonadota bacterium]